ncbi:hypothetical protein BDU57DRAFT_512694 [Ampelomyces quisqualis]|uniref:Uncharacterized protein n=1 Tax=Ampelomyces quisqualis TaxID=50730 RepID=A0A6A5QX72_AMPQU|nr:hypothetical protein BDU57DRAFT_512694 [Ampelomyces quisqualis]
MSKRAFEWSQHTTLLRCCQVLEDDPKRAHCNVEECLRGSLTKHDCSLANLSPIVSFSKLQIRKFIH